MDQIEETSDIVLTRGTEVELYFGVAKPDNLSKDSVQPKIMSAKYKVDVRSNLSRGSDKKCLSDTMIANLSTANKALGTTSSFKSESSLKRIRTPAKAIHIPVARNEDQFNSKKRLTKSASSSMYTIYRKSRSSNENIVEKQSSMREIKLEKLEKEQSNTHLLQSLKKSIESIDETSVINRNNEKLSDEKADNRSRSSITLAQKQRLQVPKCWESHSNHIKSHSKLKQKIPEERLFKKAYTPIVDVNSQYNLIAQGEKSKLAWVHRMIFPDFKDETEPIQYEQSCYFKKKPHKDHQKNLHLEKQPLALGQAHFECSDIQITTTEKTAVKSIEKSFNLSLNTIQKKVAFWNLGDDLIPQNFLVESPLNRKVRDKLSDIPLKDDINTTSLLKTATVGLQTLKSKSTKQPIKVSSLICVETSGWDHAQTIKLKFQDFKDHNSELIFDPDEKINHKLDMTLRSIPQQIVVEPYHADENSLIARGHDIFKFSPEKIEKPIDFSDGIEMIQFIVELNRRISIFQRCKRSSFQSVNVEKRAFTQQESEFWKGFAEATEILKRKFPNQFMELGISPTRIPLKPQFEKIIKLI